MKKTLTLIFITFLSINYLTLDGASASDKPTTLESATNELLPFSSDGCSDFPDGSWRNCCVDHDTKYWIGGTEDERIKADQDLKACVSKVAGSVLGEIMYLGVRMGGGPRNSSFRWGYGWKLNRGYKSVSEDVRAKAEKILAAIQDIYHLPETSGAQPAPYPTQTHNYCLDDLINRNPRLESLMKLSSDRIHVLGGQTAGGHPNNATPVTLVVSPQECTGLVVVHIHSNNSRTCFQDYYTDEQPKLIESVETTTGDCDQFVDRS